MTNRFEWKSLSLATWWKTNSLMWYIMAFISLCTGLMAYATFARSGNRFETSGYGLFLLAVVLIFCSALAAFAHLRNNPHTAQVNLRKAGGGFAITAAATALCVWANAPAPLTLACFLATAFFLAISLKNIFVWHALRPR